jgi:hypothetical protein
MDQESATPIPSFGLPDDSFPHETLLPKEETRALAFLAEHPQCDGVSLLS